ncbi:hypothetical protein HZS_4804 [Henneguya salminicola]|nr:hypothetical protein HZS_4804 [Henneguya salminicola]
MTATTTSFIHFTIKGEFIYGSQRGSKLNGPCEILNIIKSAKYSLSCYIDGYKTVEEKLLFFNRKLILSASVSLRLLNKSLNLLNKNNISFSILISNIDSTINLFNFTLNSFTLYLDKETIKYENYQKKFINTYISIKK